MLELVSHLSLPASDALYEEYASLPVILFQVSRNGRQHIFSTPSPRRQKFASVATIFMFFFLVHFLRSEDG